MADRHADTLPAPPAVPEDSTEDRLQRIEEKLDRLLSLGEGLADEAMAARQDLHGLQTASQRHSHRLGLVPCLQGIPEDGRNGKGATCPDGQGG